MSSQPLDQRPIHTPYVTTYHRRKTANGFSIDSAYLKRYFSMIDAEIFFGNEYVEDIATIDWSVNQNALPIFGYNSYTYDEVARGSRIISGSFTINFTSPNYLFDILKTAEEDSITNMASYVVNVPSGSQAAINKKLEGTGIDGNNRSPIWPETFDIDVLFGQKTEIGNPVHIFWEGGVLENCRIILDSTGAGMPNVKEAYSFIAKDIRTVG